MLMFIVFHNGAAKILSANLIKFEEFFQNLQLFWYLFNYAIFQVLQLMCKEKKAYACVENA